MSKTLDQWIASAEDYTSGEMVMDILQDWETDTAALRAEVESLKCCANCFINCNCDSFRITKNGRGLCAQWQSDSLTVEQERK